MSPTAIPGNLILKNEMVEADPFFNNVSLLLHGDGANGSTTIVDSSPSPKSVAAAGNTQINTTVTDPFGRTGFGVIAFDGSNDWAIANAPITANGDLTIEGWMYVNAMPTGAYFFDCRISPAATGAFSPLVYMTGSPIALSFALSAVRITHQSNVNLLSWNHIALVRASGVTKLFLNGVSSNTTYTDATPWTLGTSSSPVLGSRASLNGVFGLDGYIDDFRITNGVARYTSNFTPPTAPFPEVLG
jgi:hypothetical protein